jgi:type III secretion system chaperone SycN
MTAPGWIESVVEEFGRAAGLRNLALNDRGAAAVVFENGARLCLEYAFDSLSVAMTVPSRLDPAVARRLLSFTHPAARHAFRLRAGWLQKSSAAVFATRLPGREVTLPTLNSVFAELWRTAREFGGAA